MMNLRRDLLRRLRLGTTFLAVGASSAVSGAAIEAHPEIDAALRALVERGAAPGAVVIGANRRGVIYEQAFGAAYLGADKPLAMDAIFHIASMTKPVTTVALLQLVEAGKVSLDDPARKFLPEFGEAVVLESFDTVTGAYRTRPAKTAVTIRHLLTHTSGLGYPFTSATVRDFKPKEGESFSLPPLLFEPGTQWVYGTGIDYIGKIVEKVSGQDLETYFREKIFAPLGMHDTAYNVPTEKRARMVPAHHRDEDGKLIAPASGAVNPKPITAFNGGGGLRSTARDYVRFLQMLLNRGTLDGATILRPETVALMGSNQIGDVSVPALKSARPEQSYDLTFIADGRDKWGLGFLLTTEAIPGRRSAGTLSWGGIYNTYFWVDQKRAVAGAVLTQFLPFADPKALELCAEFERRMYQLAGN